QKGAVMVTREKDGTLNLGTLLAPAPTPATQAPASRPQAVKETPAPAWLVTLKKLALDGYAVRLEDKTPVQPVTFVVDPVNLSTENFSTAKNGQMKTSLRLTVNKTGTVSVDGPIGLSPLSANLKVELKGLDLVSLQPYFADKLRITITSGAASANGNLALNANS